MKIGVDQMYKLLLKRFVKDYENVSDPAVRRSYGMLSGVLGIICNIILFGVEFIVQDTSFTPKKVGMEIIRLKTVHTSGTFGDFPTLKLQYGNAGGIILVRGKNFTF